MDFKNIVKKINFSNNGYLIIIILVGVLFMLFPSNNEKKDKATDINKEVVTINYKEELENILSHISGVGDVRVMVTYSSTFEKSIAYEKNSNKNEKKDGDNTVINEISSQTNVVLSSGEPFIVKEVYPEIKGVLVVAEGADDVLVKQNIINAVTTALNIAPHKVCVVKKSAK